MGRTTPHQQPWQLPEPLHAGVNHPVLPKALLAVLRRRGLSDHDVATVLKPPAAPDPLGHFPDLALALERLRQAVSTGEDVAVCGDYDADGMTSTALLVGTLERLGARAVADIPSRKDDGYGLNSTMVERLHRAGVSLIVTVDNGVSAAEALNSARAMGIDVIVTDHHAIPPRRPPMLALLHPALTPARSPYRYLAGVGLAYLLARCLCNRLQQPAALQAGLDLFCIGTIADMAPLKGVNRLWLRQGLERLHATGLPGLQALMAAAGIQDRCIDAEDVGFRIAPRVNAVGRLDDPQLAVELLTTVSPERATVLAERCEELNGQRRELCDAIEAEALALVEADMTTPQAPVPPFLLLAQNHWHHGVIGIVAARLVERFNRPVALLAGEGNGRFRASVRAPRWFAVDRALQNCAALLDRYGGHPAAGGFTVVARHVSTLQEQLEQQAAAALQRHKRVAAIAPEAYLPLDQLNTAFLAAFKAVGPFGSGHPAPLFWTRDCRVTAQKALRGGHLRLDLNQGRTRMAAVAWRWPHGAVPGRVDVAFRISWDRRRLPHQPQLEIQALRPAQAGDVLLLRHGRRYWCGSSNGTIRLRNESGQRRTIPWPLPSSGSSPTAAGADGTSEPLNPYLRQLAADAGVALGLST